MKTITIPNDIQAVDFNTDEPAVTPDGKPVMIRWPDVVKALFNHPRVLETLSTYDAADLRTKLIAAKKRVDVSDSEHALLKEIAAKPQGTITQTALWTAIPFLRAINDAQTTKDVAAA